MKVNRETYISGATKWIGTREGDSRHKVIVANYNRARVLPRGYRLQGKDAWCAGFMSAVAVEVGCEDVFPMECSCWYMEKKAGEMGYIIDRELADVGDFVLYDWEPDGDSDHVGCVVQRNGNTLKVIEGNKNDAVGYRNIGVRSKNIRVVFRIPWADGKQENNGDGDFSRLKSVATVAKEVVNGKWGNGAERVQRLTDAGYVASDVQAAVNKILKGEKVESEGRKSVEEVAREVVRGLWGNGNDRRTRLRNAGYDYTAIQKRVNEIYKNGV